MFIRPWLDALKSRWMPGKRRTPKRWNGKPLQHNVEALEERVVLSAFDLVTVIPNQGVFLTNNSPTPLAEAPREMTLRFSPGQNIDPTSLGAITVTRAGLDGIFNDPSTPAVESTDDIAVDLMAGYVGVGDNPNEVIVRFASTLPDDKYQIRIQASGANALVGDPGDSLTPDVGKTYKTFAFELDLGSQVEAVVPQPVIRDQIFSATQFSNLTDGDIVSINAGPYSYRFEINLTGSASNGIPVNIGSGATPTQIADALVTEINANATGILTASNNGNVITVAGSSFEPVVTFTTTKIDAFAKSNVTILGTGAQFADGDLFRVTLTNPTTSINTVYTFELNKLPNNSVGGGNIRVDFGTVDDASAIAGKIATAINNLSINTPTAKLSAIAAGSSIALAATSTLGTPVVTVVTATPNLVTQPAGALSQKTDQVVVYFNQDELDTAIAEDPTYYRLLDTATAVLNVSNYAALTEATTLSVALGATTLTFEFDTNGSVSGSNIQVDLTSLSTAAQVAGFIAAQINNVVVNPAQVIQATVNGEVVAITGGNSGKPTITSTTNPGALTQTTKVLLPDTVDYFYNPANGLSAAVLKFGAALPNTSYNIKIGSSTERSGTDSANPINAGAIYSNQDFIANDWIGDGVGSSVNSSATDVDLYQFSTTAAGIYTFTLNSSSTLDGVITFYNASAPNTPIATINSNGLGGTESFTTGMLGNNQTFYVKVSGNAGTGSYTLTLEANSGLVSDDNNSSFDPITGVPNSGATDLGNLGTSGITVTGHAIEAQSLYVIMPQLPGGSDEPGHRDLPAGAFPGSAELGHGTGTTADPAAPAPTAERTYSFPLTYGSGLNNQITPEQRAMARQILQIYANYSGIQFREVAAGTSSDISIITGDPRAIDPTIDPLAVGGIASGSSGYGTAIINAAGSQASDGTYGGGWFGTAVHEIGHVLGLGHSYDIPSIQGNGLTGEAVFPGDNDIVHLLRLFPDNSSDIDLYKFTINQSGTLSAQTIAERLGGGNLLDTVLTLYREDANGVRTVVARNDDFYSKDSGLQIALSSQSYPATYYIGVTSTGNDNYDPSIANSGNGGTSRGNYDLKLNFEPTVSASSNIADTTGRSLDGDHDGKVGGEYSGWFVVAPTVFVDKLAPADGADGTTAHPYQTIGGALTAGVPAGSILRIVGNGGADGDASTVADNAPYVIGNDYVTNAALPDGSTFQVPKDVTVMIDAGALIKVRGQTIDVGTSSQGTDRSHGSLQVLGTPVTNVTFTSWRDDSKGSLDDGTNGAAAGADWGGIVFRQDSDSAVDGTFVNLVNHATLQYGGGQVSVDGGQLRVYNVIDLETSRPTISNNTIKNNADAAISANPDSFKADDGRIGPDIHGNTVTQNSTNGLFIRIQTSLGSAAEQLNVIARFDDTDITHVITQNLILNGHPAGDLSGSVSARLMIDPGTIIKLSGARIETGLGSSNLIAEGTAENPIRFTSQQDDKYGIGGTFDLKNDQNTTPLAGNWSGIFLQPTSTASFDHVSITYAGGASEVAGNTDNFNAIESLQANLRVANSVFENNAGGAATTGRGGRGGNEAAAIFVRGAQPIIVDNVFRNNVGYVVSINANSLQDSIQPDSGRSTGALDRFSAFDDNYGPLVRLNTYEGNGTNGMHVRAEELTIESVWDDTDIAHVVTGTISSSEFHTYGGLRLQSSTSGSLVVKLQGATAGFAATGDPLEIDDRIGGTVQIIGQPGFPVVLTSLKDDTVSAGFLPNGFPSFDTNGDGASTPQAGDWNSVSFDQNSNDRNVAIVNETEPAQTHGNDLNATVGNPQPLGNLAPNVDSGDENRRLGFEVHGFISADSPSDMDVYSFTANAGTEVWIDLDFTSDRLDAMVELVSSNGQTVLARSLNSIDEQNGVYPLSGTLYNTVGGVASTIGSDLNPLTKDPNLGGDFYTKNFHDAGFRVVLPGTTGTTNTYFVRVRSQPATNPTVIPGTSDPAYKTLTSGAYQLQVRLRQQDEQPGSTVRYADIRYATNGIELHGLPAHSPVTGEAAEISGNNNDKDGAQTVGPLLQVDRNTISMSGNLSTATDVDFYKFTVDYSQIQVIAGSSDGGKYFPVVIDLDWADGLTRPDTSIAVYDSTGKLIYVGRASDIADDQPAPGQGQDVDDQSRGSVGTRDPYIGPINLPAGVDGDGPASGLTTYYVAVYSNGMTPTVLTANFDNGDITNPTDVANQLVRLEPVNSVRRIVEDHIGLQGYQSQKSLVSPINGPLFDLGNQVSLSTNIRAFTLSDVNLFVTTSSGLYVFDPYYGRMEIDYADYAVAGVQDLDMRSDGRLFGVRSNTTTGANEGFLIELDTGTGAAISATGDAIPANDGSASPALEQQNEANTATALAIHRKAQVATAYDYMYYAIPDADRIVSPTLGVSKLYRATEAGSAAFVKNSFGAVGLITDGGVTPLITSNTTGMQYGVDGALYGVSAGGQFYRISDGTAPNTDNGNGISNSLAFDVTNFSGNAALNGAGFAGLTTAPQNVSDGAYADLLFAITTTGRIVAIDPGTGAGGATLVTIFDNDNNSATGTGGAESNFLQLKNSNGGAMAVSATGIAFSPVDFNLWHPSLQKSGEAGHGITTPDDNSRNPSGELRGVPGAQFLQSESSGGTSMYFGLEEYGSTIYYGDMTQWGVLSEQAQRDLTSNASIGNNYNVPGGAAGSLVTNAFSMEGYTASDQPVLYFNYWLDTAKDAGNNRYAFNEMTDSARVYISTDDGLTWSLVATNNTTFSDDTRLTPDAELPTYLSTDSNASTQSNQGVQELFDSGSWRQARIDLRQYVGTSTVKLRFDFATSGRNGTVVDPTTGLRVASNDPANPTYVDNVGGEEGVPNSGERSNEKALDNNHVGFFIDDIIVGFAGRGEMVTNAPSNNTAFTNLLTAQGLDRRTFDTTPYATPQLLQGDYQLSIRGGEDYGALVDASKPDVLISPILDINDRLTNGQTVFIGGAVDGDKVTVSDGIITRTFEFESSGGVTAGNLAVTIGGTRGATAANLATQINAQFGSRNSVIAKAVGASTNSDRVDIFGATSVTAPLAAATDLGFLNDPLGGFGVGDGYPINGIANVKAPLSSGTPGNYLLHGEVGDGPQPTQDLDFIRLNLTAGQIIRVDLDITNGVDRDSFMVLVDGGFNLRAVSFDDAAPGESSSHESYFLYQVTTTGVYYLGIGGDDRKSSTLPFNTNAAFPASLATTGNDTFTYDLNISLMAAGAFHVESYTRKGDDNLPRQQGQIVIENNSILHSLKSGILVDDSQIGASANTPVTTAENLVTGLYIQNNVVAGFGQSGIDINGQTNAAILTEGEAATPFVKVVNNTIVNTGNIGVGIRATNNVSPTLMNNAIVGTATAILIDASSTSTEVEANLFQNNTATGTAGNNSLVVANGIKLFVDATKDNYYPAPGSALIDSSRSNFNDRATYSSVVGALGIPPSPIIAPLFDRYGQLRVDDGAQAGPPNQPGLGQNPFQDRGALERADFDGGLVIPTVPQDNDGSGFDLDRTTTNIWIDAATPGAEFSIFTTFTLQLIDNGVGIDDSTVIADYFRVLKNGALLDEGTDYFFTYNQNTNECIFTSVSTFELDSRYQIVLDGQRIRDLADNPLQNNQAAPFSSINPNVAAPFDSSLLYFTYIVTDGENTAPVNTAPAAVSLNEDTSIAFTGANTISVTDADAFLASDGDPTMSSDGGRIHVSLSVPDGFGTLTLGSTLVLTQNGGAASGTGTAADPLVFDGRITDINAVLAGLIFTPPADFPPTVQPAIPLTIATSDLGKFGTPVVANVTTTVVNITVNPVNDRPAFVKGLDRNDKEGDPAVVNAAWASGISTGAANETTQTVQFQVTANTNTSLFSVLPTINAAGQLSYTLAPDAFGFADITVVIKDNGGTANGGIDTSAPQTFRINVAPLNDAPSFVKGADENVSEDAGVRTVPSWATSILAGPANESSQVVTFQVTGNTNPGLFEVAPTISANGTLSYKLAANANGFADITVRLKDNGGTLNVGDVDTSAPQTFRINVAPLNDAPTYTKGANQNVLGDVLFNSVSGWASNITAGPADESGQTVQFIVTGNSDPSLFTVQPAIAPDGTLTYTLSPTADGEATITFHLEDNGATGGGNVNRSADDTFKIRVTVNNAPSFTLAGPETQSNEDFGPRTVANWATSISAGPPDEAGQVLTFIVTNNTNAALFSVAPAISSTGVLTYTLAPNANGFADVTVVLKDDGGTHFGVDTSAPQTFRITANALNDAPSFTKGADQNILETDTPQVVTGWATNLSAGPADESGQTLSFNVVGNTNPGLFLVAPAIAPNGTLTYTLAPNAVGSAAIRVNLADNGSFGNGNVNVSADQTFNIVVTGVNDAPSFVKGSDQSVTENYTLQTVAGWATSISAGPANEGSQTVSFIVTGNTNPGLFAVAPSISPNGTLTYQIQQYTPGIATITVKLQDSGGTLNGGVDTSTEQTFVIESIVIYDAPTDIGLSGPKTVTENLPAGTVVGTLTSVDPDIPAGTFTYSLVTGAGSSGNDAFIISGDQLLTNQSFNFEAQSSYSIRIRTTDNTGRTFDKIFTIQILDVNEAATTINTSVNPATGVPNSILENRPTNSIVGTLLTDDVDIGDVTTFTLVAGAGSTDNSLFFISGNSLIAKPSFNYEAKSSYTVRIRAVDSRNAAFETPLTITVFNVNEAPTNINLSGNSVVENSPVGTPIGDFSTIDPDAGDTFTYSFVSGPGSTDNGKFEIVNGQLQVAIPPDYEYPGHFYTIRVRATDAGNNGSSLSFEKTFTISIVNVNEAPTGLTLVDQSVEENKPIGTVVGTLATVDPDVPDVFTYALVSGDGADDNNLFSISGDKLVTATTFDFETRTAYSVRVRTTDSSGHQFESSFAITITDGKDAPIISLSPTPITTRVRKPIQIDPGAQFSDRDSDVFDGGKLVVKIYSGEQPGDALRIMKGSFNGLTLKAVRGNTVLKLGKQEIATISGGSDFIPLTITFRGNVSTELFQKVMQSITLKAKPYPAPRVISMQAYDETGLASNIAMRSIEVT